MHVHVRVYACTCACVHVHVRTVNGVLIKNFEIVDAFTKKGDKKYFRFPFYQSLTFTISCNEWVWITHKLYESVLQRLNHVLQQVHQKELWNHLISTYMKMVRTCSVLPLNSFTEITCRL